MLYPRRSSTSASMSDHTGDRPQELRDLILDTRDGATREVQVGGVLST
jgi:hypothetical protein